MTVTVFGIRHHGPGSARGLRRALEQLDPDVVLVEGPSDASDLVPFAVHEEMRPPVALLLHDVKDPGRAVFYPFAEFSPEWQAIGYALRRERPVRFIDLPAANVLAQDESREQPDELRGDPLRILAEAAGHGDPERWWEDVVEHRDGELDAFDAIADAMGALREEIGERDGPDGEREARREAHMRQAIRTAVKEGGERVAVVCGAWHAPALRDLPPAAHDARTLKGMAKTKVAAAWVPWTYDRLSYGSGYGAGVTSPGWYDHVFTTAEDVLVRWVAKVARLLRGDDVDISSAHLIEAVRLAEALAAVRERPLAGLPELTEATRAVLGYGSEAEMALIHDRLVVGEVLGEVPADAPAVPLQADLQAEQRRLRLKAEASVREIDLDLRKPGDLARSHLLHRLRLLDIPWGAQRAAQGKRGTFHELWVLEWVPELAVRVIEASMWGTTVRAAATASVRATGGDEASLPILARLVETSLLADLPDAVAHTMERVETRAALAGDVEELMDALPPLARVSRYGSVRDTDRGAVGAVVEGLGTRVCIGLPPAATGLDDDAAAELVARVDAVHGAIALVEDGDLRGLWDEALGRLVERPDVHGLLAGRAARLLYDGGVLDADATARRMGLALSVASDPAQAAGWIEGFLAGSGLVLIHDAQLLRILDEWVSGVARDDYTALLPVLRRAVADFSGAERRQIGDSVKRLGDPQTTSAPADAPELDQERADSVLPVLALVLGIEEGL